MKTRGTTTFGALLSHEAGAGDPREAEHLRRLQRRLLVPIVTVCALFAAWAIYAPLSGAVVAPAHIKVEMNRKTVQHQEGGIVRELLVRDGQKVRAGQPLLVIGDLRSQAELNEVQDQMRAERARVARASAEAILAPTLTIPADEHASGTPSDYAARESALFTARRRTLDEQIVALETQAREAHAQSTALESQIAAGVVSAKLATDELAINEKLVRDGFVQGARILQLRRAESDYQGRIAESRSELALAQQRAADLNARIAQARNQYQQQAADELKDATARLRQLEERLQPARDQVERQIVRSPVDGEVMALRVSGVAAVIAPREPLLEVVPSQERLVVEAQIRPQDINHVHRGANAQVRLTSFDTRTTPLLSGKVTFVSGDRIVPPDDRESFFTATVEVDAADLKRHSQIELQPGMPAELYVATSQRSLIQYLLRPLDAFAQHALREP